MEQKQEEIVENESDNDLDNIIPKHETFSDDKTFDFEEHKLYFNETFFKNSKLFRL